MPRAAGGRTHAVFGLLTTAALLVGTIHPAGASADSGSAQPLTLAVSGPPSLVQGAQGTLEVTVGPADSAAATGTVHVESTPMAGGDPIVVADEPGQPGDDPVTVPITADVPRHYVVTFVPDDPATWTAPDQVPFDVDVTPSDGPGPTDSPAPTASPAPTGSPPPTGPGAPVSAQPVTLTVTGPSSLVYRSQDALVVTVGPADSAAASGTLHVESTPVAGGDPGVVADAPARPGDDPVMVPIVADVPRHYVVAFVPDDPTTWAAPDPVSVDVDVTSAVTVTTVAVLGLPASGAAVKPGPTVWRSFGGLASVTLVDGDGVPVPGAALTLQQRSLDTNNVWVTVATVQTGSAGAAGVQVNPWRDTTYRAVFAGTAGKLDPSQSAECLVRPATPGVPVVAPAGAPRPRATPPLGRGVGIGANAVVNAVPNNVWASMLGRSYSTIVHCPVGRTKLSYILINYWGFDGNRYRGELVVAKNRAASFARAFTTLYNLHFPIRVMVRPDRFGRSPHGWPGANDYKSMTYDNTYAFNCRYVVGRESSKRMSPHAYGFAVDVNTWENPDVAGNGTHPNRWFAVHRSGKYGGVIMSRSAVVKAFRTAGLGWGGTAIRDYQHFDPTLL